MADGTIQRPPTEAAIVDDKQRVEKAKQAFSKGELDQAEIWIAPVALSGKASPGVLMLWTRIAHRQRKPEIASERAERALRTYPDKPDLLLLAAEMQANLGRRPEALARIDQAIAQWPEDWRLYLRRFALLRDLKQRILALRQLRQLRHRWPSQAHILLMAARFYEANGHLTAAQTALQRLLEQHPEHPEARKLANAVAEKRLLKQVSSAIKASRFEEADALADPAVKSGNTQPRLLDPWVRIAVRRNNLDEALARVQYALEQHPGNADMFLLSIDVRIAAQLWREALERSDEGIARWPEDSRFLLRRLKLLREPGQRPSALEVLRQLRRRWPTHAHVQLAVARFYQANGRLTAASTTLQRLLAHNPSHPEARKLADAIDEKKLIKKTWQAIRGGELDLAESLIRAPAQAANASPAILNAWTRLARHQGKTAAALERAEQGARLHPGNRELNLLLVEMQAEAGYHHDALQRVEEAVGQHPDDNRFWLRKFTLLRDMDRKTEAIHALRDLRRRWPDHVHILMPIARFYQAHGRLAAAAKILEHILRIDPEHSNARLAMLEVSQEQARDKDTQSLLSGLLGKIEKQAGCSATDAAELLKAVELAASATSAELRNRAIDLLSEHGNLLTEQGRLSLFNLADQLERYDAANRTLACLLDNGPRQPGTAIGIFRKVLACLGSQQADAIAARLLRHIPRNKHASLDAEFAFEREGPESALAHLRREQHHNRSPQEAMAMVRLLKLAAPAALTLRYTRLCHRRWPEHANVRLNYAGSLVGAGYPEAALRQFAIRPGDSRKKKTQLASIRATALTQMGKLQDALRELEAGSASKTEGGSAFMRLRILMALGREKEAWDVMHEIRRCSIRNSNVTNHFSVSLHGNLLNDLLLYRTEQASLPPGDHGRYLAVRYIHAASPFIASHTRYDESTTPSGDELIPRQVFQYWNQPVLPERVADIMRSWSTLPGVGHERFDDQAAGAFLRENFGSDYERAFKLANNVAEGSDLLRLCYLSLHGGVYADADDRLYGKLDALIPPGAGLVCYAEPYNILANNFIACRPGHPAIVLARDLAAEALLARDNDNTWSKTGPGMFTRAVGSYLSGGSGALPPQDQVAIFPLHILRRQVQLHIPLPHKKTRSYWNAANVARRSRLDLSPLFAETQAHA